MGTTLITAHTASRKAYEFLMMPMSMIATATATFVSQNYGAGKIDRITGTIKKVMGIELVWSVFPVISSSIELIVKIIAAEVIIPTKGYVAVVATEPVAWVICAVFLVIVYAITYKNKLNLKQSKGIVLGIKH